MCVSVSFLQHLDDLRQQVSRVSGAQQVQQNLLTVFITDDLIQRRQDLLNRQKIDVEVRWEFCTITTTFYTSSNWWSWPDCFLFFGENYSQFLNNHKCHWTCSNHVTSGLLRAPPVWPAWCRPRSRTWPAAPGGRTPPVDKQQWVTQET